MKHHKPLQANIAKFYAFAVLFWIVFWQPIIVLFWLENGVTMAQVYLIKSIHGLTMIVLEVPSGALADYLGKRYALFWATVAGVCSLVLYSIGSGFVYFCAAEILAAVGTSLISGADSAFVHETLGRLGRSQDFDAVMGRVVSLQLIAQAVSGILGGVMGNYSFRWTLYASLITTIPCTFITFSMVEPHLAGQARAKSYRQILVEGFRLIVQNHLLAWLTVYFAFLVAFDLVVLWAYQPYMELAGLPVLYFGAAFAFFNLAAALASRCVGLIQHFVRPDALLAALPLLMIAATFLMAGVLAPWSFVFILGLQITRGLRVPIVHAKVLERVPGDQQATVLSIASLASRVIFFVLSPVFGWLAENRGLPPALFISGLIAVLVFGGMGLWYYGRGINRLLAASLHA